MISTADISPCGKYRYSLTRTWDADKPDVVFIGLNPSTADAYKDDPTIRRCVNFAKAWGGGRLIMLNLFAFRATNPADMLNTVDPVGPDNDITIFQTVTDAEHIVAAWGNDGGYMKRSMFMRQSIPFLKYLKLNRSGEPAHPLYLSSTLTPQAFRQ